MFGFGYGELLVVGVIGLLLFGNRLPSTMKSLGEGIRGFQSTLRGEGAEDELPVR